MATRTPATTFHVPPHVRSASMDGTLILMEMKTGQYYSLDAVGPLIWRQLSLGRSVAEIEEAVASEYDAADQLIKRDVAKLLSTLEQASLIVTNP